MASITEALKIEEGWLQKTEQFLKDNYEKHETVSDIMEETALFVRSEEFGEDVDCKLSTYEKKLVMMGFMLGNFKQRSNLEEMHHSMMMEVIAQMIKSKFKEDGEE
jgi:hypothetical protein